MASSSHSSKSSNYDEELAKKAKRALAYLQRTRKYRYVEFLAQGAYGWVASVYDDRTKLLLAVKCTTEATEMELSWWKKLDHPNILPLLDHIELDACTVFIMPTMRKDLLAVVKEPHFYEKELSFGLCRIWLKDVASALAYLHGQLLCHLDLKLDNVFLKEDGYVCLGDFTLISDIRKVPRDFSSMEFNEPPEYAQWYHGAPDSIATTTLYGGDKADMWQYGILSLDLLTNRKLTDSRNSDFILFRHDVWPLLEKVLLYPEYLHYLLENTFDNVIFEPETLKLCHGFLKGLLCLKPNGRLSAEKARDHEFTNTEWPELPKDFSLPEHVVEHFPEPKPLQREEMDGPNKSVQVVLTMADQVEEESSEDSTRGATDATKMKMVQKMMNMQESTAVEGSKLAGLEIPKNIQASA